MAALLARAAIIRRLDVSRARNFSTREHFSTRERATCLGAGVLGGCLGGLVGLGGGAVMVPVIASWTRLSQHAAVGTSSAAVAATGVSGCASFGSAGAVDLVAAGTIAATAMVGARIGAKLTAHVNGVQLARAFAVFQLCVAPMVPLKAKMLKHLDANDPPPTDDAPPPVRTLRQAATLGGVGLLAGVAGGLFGIGGGVIVTPALCLVTDLPHAAVLGTTLASMIAPSLVSLGTHARLGNVLVAAVLPLCAGSAVGAFAGGQLALVAPEEPLQVLFAVVIGLMGAQKLWALRGR